MAAITIADLSRLSTESCRALTPEQWMEKNEIDKEVMLAIIAQAFDDYFYKVDGGCPPSIALAETVANAFMFGWEAAIQFSMPRTATQ
jgi:hypothetical protein